MSDSIGPIFEKVALIGVGLIGSSMAHAMRRGGLASHIAGYTHRAETLERARQAGFADSLHSDVALCVKDADLVVLATPVGAYAALAEQIAPYLKRGAILHWDADRRTARRHNVRNFVCAWQDKRQRTGPE